MNFNDWTALALDPSRILTSLNMQPDDWQRNLLASNADRILLCCSRGAGKSRTCSALALHTALFEPGSLILLLSRTQRQAQEMLRYVKEGADAIGATLLVTRSSENHLELDNHSRILALPGQEETIRTYQGVRLIILDEAARIPDELYFTVRPMLNVSRGRLVCLSTPFGPHGFFWREWHDTSARWQRERITWEQCPRITPDQIAEERRTMGDLWVAQEYECSFVSREGLVYPSFGECLVEMDTLPIGRRLGGIDFGWRNPFAAIWGMVDEDDVLWILGEHYASETPIHEHALILQQQPGVLWLADPAGRSEIESLRAAGLKVRSADNNIRHGIAAVNARIRTGRLKVWQSRCPELIRESRLYHYPRVEEVDARTREIPIDSDNHALAALRYLISKLDAGFLARLRQREHSPNRQDKAKRLAGPEYRDEQLWTTLF